MELVQLRPDDGKNPKKNPKKKQSAKKVPNPAMLLLLTLATQKLGDCCRNTVLCVLSLG
jgi:hypothetical protein